jgi:hypothetical protein
MPDIEAVFAGQIRGFELVEIAEQQLKHRGEASRELKARLEAFADKIDEFPAAIYTIEASPEGRERPGRLLHSAEALVQVLARVPPGCAEMTHDLPRGYVRVAITRANLGRPIFLPPAPSSSVGDDIEKVLEHLGRPKKADYPVDILAHFCMYRGPWREEQPRLVATLSEALERSPYERLWVYHPLDDLVDPVLEKSG